MKINVGIGLNSSVFLSLFSGAFDEQYADIIGLWSTRRAFSNYDGKALRLRRASDNDETVIGFDGANLDNTSANDFANGSDLFVKTWYDQKGAWIDDDNGTDGLDVLQSTSSAQPKLVLSSINNKPSILFDGSDDALGRNYVYSSAGSLAWIIVGKDVSISDSNRIISMPGQTDTVDWNNVRSVVPIWQKVSPNRLGAYRDHAEKGNLSHPGTNTPYIISSIWDETDHKFYLYGGTPNTVANSGVFSTLRLRFGCGMGAPDVNGSFSNVHLSEVILAGGINTSNHNIIGNSQSEYFNINWDNVS